MAVDEQAATERSVTVIIPSTARRERVPLLRRAIASVRDQQGIRAIPLVVLNGAHRTAEVEAELRADSQVQLVVLAEGSLAGALNAGRTCVKTRWFGTLDDDDVLLPSALATRVRALEEHPEMDVVVTNGITRIKGEDSLHMSPMLDIGSDPLRVLMKRNWLLPGSWLARSDRVGVTFFEGMPRYRECTYIAIRFAAEYKMMWLAEPTMIWNAESPFSESRSRAYLLGQVEAIQALMALDIPPHFRRYLRWQIAAASHQSADLLWSEGSVENAWRLHWQSLLGYWGVRYIPFTRFLVMASLRKMFSRVAVGDSL
ncbi:MAG: glycosyltransferase family A protein [Gemmatimonadaceae bacterium]